MRKELKSINSAAPGANRGTRQNEKRQKEDSQGVRQGAFIEAAGEVAAGLRARIADEAHVPTREALEVALARLDALLAVANQSPARGAA